MRGISNVLVLLASVCLLAGQVSGTHMHVDLGESHADTHGTRLHHADPDGHEHKAHVDISLAGLRASGPELLPFILATVIALVGLVCSDWRPRPLPPEFVRIRPRPRWRPPLRAPPL